jgi:hypothetical protein
MSANNVIVIRYIYLIHFRIFRHLVPMRNREHMVSIAAGIEIMTIEEAGYWLGMAMHRKHLRRVLMTLRFLLLEAAR